MDVGQRWQQMGCLKARKGKQQRGIKDKKQKNKKKHGCVPGTTSWNFHAASM